MGVNLLPIVKRELGVAARRRSTYSLRWRSALLVLLLESQFFFLLSRFPPGRMGRGLMANFSALALLYCWLGGLGYTADALSMEKREGTMGLLFLTNLRGYDVVLGKLTGAAIKALCPLLAALPLLQFPILLGGVNPLELLQFSLAILNLLFFSLAAGMVGSVLCRSYRGGYMTALVLLALASFSGFAAEWIYFRWTGRHITLIALQWINPLSAATAGLQRGYTAHPPLYWEPLIGSALTACGFLGFCAFWLPRTWREKASSVKEGRWGRWSRIWRLGTPAQRKRHRLALLAVNPVYWLGSRDRLQPYLLAVAIFTSAGLLLWGLFSLRWPPFGTSLALTGFALLLPSILLKLVFSLEAVRLFGEGRRQRILELLLVTPVSVARIVRAQWRVLGRAFVIATAGLLAFNLCGTLYIFSNRRFQFEGAALEFFVGEYVGILLADLITCGWLGLWQGLTADSQQKALSAVWRKAILLPTLFFLTILSVTLALSAIYPTWARRPAMRRWLSDPGHWVAFWLMCGIANDLIFSLWARARLYGGLRRVAAQPYATSESGRFWRRWFAGKG